ncbi:MAG: DUF222 domain-containing protein [Gammaproteobacteria bacterium]|nr:DUF222 domain-containing protein [Gammaproteobacteria bacterium]NIR85029.1 DUF222 domain-containing protein [Gammaproteobacteria bacterium]NIR88296.1 DUF222 domain-containing protein [Gammaproteobacteria bacterium]NIU06076.1 DUF222 domain-containing protein [Gammaproteobacteria bacterium]NIV73495.1 DUF222 domain-containing protein [Gammaproteobacteria bacterium]
MQKALEAALDEEDRRWWADVRERRDAAEKDVSAETPLQPRDVSAETRSGNRDTQILVEALQEREPAGARRADALLSMAETLLEHGPASGSGGDRYQIVVHTEAAGLEDPASAARSAIEHGPALPGHTLRRLACDASVVRMLVDGEGEPLSVGRKTRTIPPAIRRALKTRDGGCRYPGCTALRFLDAHHVKHWADGGETRLSNLVQLCRFHHHLLHEGGFGMKVLDDGALVFTRPDGRRVGPAARGHPRDPPGAEALMRSNRACGLTIDATTGECLWLGERMDLSSAVEGVLYGSG